MKHIDSEMKKMPYDGLTTTRMAIATEPLLKGSMATLKVKTNTTTKEWVDEPETGLDTSLSDDQTWKTSFD